MKHQNYKRVSEYVYNINVNTPPPPSHTHSTATQQLTIAKQVILMKIFHECVYQQKIILGVAFGRKTH